MTKAFDCAVRLLARREHGMHELIDKLMRKGYTPKDSQDAVLKCQELDLQSDTRLAELICYTRFKQGYGPIKIMYELQSKRIAKDIIHQALLPYQDQWEEQAKFILQKKFKGVVLEKQKQQHFLKTRGFPLEVTKYVNHDEKF